MDYQVLAQIEKVSGGCKVEGHSEGEATLTSAFSNLEAWLTFRPASTAASSEPGSGISSMMGSGDDVSDKLVVSTTGPLSEDFVVHSLMGSTPIWRTMSRQLQ